MEAISRILEVAARMQHANERALAILTEGTVQTLDAINRLDHFEGGQ